MPTLTIGDKKVTVGDDFLKLSPEQQQATVDEIAGQLDIGQPAPADPVAYRDQVIASRAPGVDHVNPETGNAIPEFIPRGADGLPIPGYNPKSGNVDKLGATGTFAAAMPEGIPIIGPLLDKTMMAGSAGLGSLLTGDPYAKVRSEMQVMKDVGNEEHPVARTAGNITGGIAALGPLGGTEAGGWALGTRGATLGGRILRSSLSSGGISAADTAARGGDTADVLESGAIGTTLGGAIPALGAGIKTGIESGADFLKRILGAAANPTREAERRLGSVLARDAAANPGKVLSASDEAAAQAAGVPISNVDRGGETTRALARSVANQAPEARAGLENLANDRFAGQSQRASTFINKIMGGNVDDIAYQQSLRDMGRIGNGPAYDAAFSHPNAQAMWSPELQQLMQAPAMQRAAMQATTRGANRSAVEGFKAIKNPFHQARDGAFKLRQNADGTMATPTLQFWDQTKRNLDSMIGKAKVAGDKTLVGDLTALKRQLVDTLDGAVPLYKQARQGAAVFFGAEDALEAGKKFVMTPKAIPEARKAFLKFSAADRKAFSVGYASELIDRIKASPDRLNVVNSVFKSQAARESMELALGPQRAKQIESYVRVETLVDRLRGALGGSTTTRQLTELGLGGVAGGAYTGDWSGFFTGAGIAGGIRHGGGFVRNRLEQNVMRELGQILTADDPALIQRLVTKASQSPRYMKALEGIGNALAVPARTGVIEGNRQ